MEKILITPQYGLGDTLLFTPALELLKKSRPDIHCTVFTFSMSCYELLQMNPSIDTLLYFPLIKKSVFESLWYIFRNLTGKFSASINFYPSNRRDYNLFSALTFSRKRVGHTYLYNNFSQFNWLKNTTVKENLNLHCVEENIALLDFFGIDSKKVPIGPLRIYLSDTEKEKAREQRNTIREKLCVGVHTGCSSFKNQAQRRWHPHKFAELIDLHPEIHFFLFGTGEEQILNAQIHAHANNQEHVTVVSDRNIRDTAALIGTCDYFISNDSGLMHIAAAMNVPTLAILGPTNETFIRPWHVPHRIARLKLGCAPCFYYSPKPLTCKRNNTFACVNELDVSAVEKEFEILMKEHPLQGMDSVKNNEKSLRKESSAAALITTQRVLTDSAEVNLQKAKNPDSVETSAEHSDSSCDMRSSSENTSQEDGNTSSGQPLTENGESIIQNNETNPEQKDSDFPHQTALPQMRNSSKKSRKKHTGDASGTSGSLHTKNRKKKGNTDGSDAV